MSNRSVTFERMLRPVKRKALPSAASRTRKVRKLRNGNLSVACASRKHAMCSITQCRCQSCDCRYNP